MQYLTIKNWEKHQHYKDRSPPWIKLHREILDDYEMSCLQDASKLHLILIWVLSSQLNNKIPNDAAWISKKINATTKVNLKELIDKGFLVVEQSASSALAECSPETEAYREETDNIIIRARMDFKVCPDDWVAWAKSELEWEPEVIEDIWNIFRDYWANGKGKSTKRDNWTATWKTWCRGQYIKKKQKVIANDFKKETEEQMERLSKQYAK